MSNKPYPNVAKHIGLAAYIILCIGFFSLRGAIAAEQSGADPSAPQADEGASTPAARQGNTETIATHADWQVQCDTFTSNDKPVRQCGMIQTVKNEQRQNIGLSAVIARLQQDKKEVAMMRVLVPLGVFLPAGIGLEIDDQAIGRIPFTSCPPRLCMAMAEITPDMLEKLKKGKTANFVVYEAPGAGLSMKVSLKGFTAAYENLGDL
ncbi:MAG: invasion associated locus B family protein [Hyphomicrobiales bacterium]